MSSQYGELRPTSGWDRFVSLGTPGNLNGFRVLAALLHCTLVVGVSRTLRHWTEGTTYIRQCGHHVGHWPTFLVTTTTQQGDLTENVPGCKVAMNDAFTFQVLHALSTDNVQLLLPRPPPSVGIAALNRGYMCNYCMQFVACNYCMQLFSARRPSGAKIIACKKLHAIILGPGQGYLCQSVCDWWRHIRNVLWQRITVIITWFHQTLSLAATLWPHEYFRTRLKACNYCMQELQHVACNNYTCNHV